MLAITFVELVLTLQASFCWSMTESDTISEIIGEELLEQYSTYVSGPYGSPRGGEWFTDFYQSLDGTVVRPKHWPSQINVGAGERVDSVELIYGPYHGGFHGGEGGKLHKIRLYQGDRIVKVTGRKGIGPGAGIDQLTFYTKHGHKFGPYGGEGGVPFTARPPKLAHSDCYLAYISGRAYLRVDALTFYWRCPITYGVTRPALGQEATSTASIPLQTGLRTGAAKTQLFFRGEKLLFILIMQFVFR